jgi:hypothetical protein
MFAAGFKLTRKTPLRSCVSTFAIIVSLDSVTGTSFLYCMESTRVSISIHPRGTHNVERPKVFFVRLPNKFQETAENKVMTGDGKWG